MKAIWLMLLLALQAGDILTTIKILNAGGRELNPLLRWLFKRFPYVPAIVGAKLLVTAPVAYIVLAYPELWSVPAAGCVVLSIVLVNNLLVLSRQSRVAK